MTGGMLGRRHSEETKRKIGDGNRGKQRSPEFILFLKSRAMSDETKQKLREANVGKKHSDETKRKIGESNIGKHNHPVYTEESIRKMREAKLGRKLSEAHKQKLLQLHIGRKNTDETKQKMREAQLGKRVSEATKLKLRNINLGHRHTPEACRKISEAHSGENNHGWKGGISFAPYCSKFNKDFKRRVRVFFNNACVECGALVSDSSRVSMHVHHVNYDKMVCCSDTKPMFVTLCTSCHMKTNFNRPYWEKHFIDIINTRYGGKCYIEKTEAGK